MQKITINTSKEKEIIDITNFVNDLIMKNGFNEGICFLNTTHTSCGITIGDLDPGTDQDYLDAFEHMVPDLEYRHGHDPGHVGDHIMSALVGGSLSLPVQSVSLELGKWQRLMLVELNGPKERHILVNFIPTR